MMEISNEVKMRRMIARRFNRRYQSLVLGQCEVGKAATLQSSIMTNAYFVIVLLPTVNHLLFVSFVFQKVCIFIKLHLFMVILII
jgi:hypothetical protein